MTGRPSGDFLAKRRRYRRAMFAFVAVGVLGFILASTLEYHLVAVGVYWAGVLGFVAVWKGTGTTLQDERERALERWASAVTLLVAAVALVASWPALYALEQADRYVPPPWLDGMLLGWGLLFGVFAVVYVGRRFSR